MIFREWRTKKRVLKVLDIVLILLPTIRYLSFIRVVISL